MSAHVVINILTTSELREKEEGKKLLEEWVLHAPQYAPERYGGYEPIRTPFDPADIDAAVSEWDFSFLVSRRKPKMRGSVFMGNGRGTRHGWIHVACEYKPELFPQLRQFFMKVSTGFEAEFAFMHMSTRKLDLSISITTHQLRQGIPDLYWLTLFGKPYVRLFGSERILSSPNAVVEELTHDLFTIQLSGDIRDITEKPDELFETSRRIKQHLNNNAFFDSELGLDYPYNVPEFHIRQ